MDARMRRVWSADPELLFSLRRRSTVSFHIHTLFLSSSSLNRSSPMDCQSYQTFISSHADFPGFVSVPLNQALLQDGACIKPAMPVKPFYAAQRYFGFLKQVGSCDIIKRFSLKPSSQNPMSAPVQYPRHFGDIIASKHISVPCHPNMTATTGPANANNVGCPYCIIANTVGRR
ncbi:hypothetical protein C8J56DRAFT_923461 [Mycena floridula]|nr:hypothetical protein C8J56DRAFT_923461 [Mycena floridula]